MKIVAVTSCATGIAHTYLAAEKLERISKKLGHSIKIETQGIAGIENELSQSDIATAEAAILAVDGALKKASRFASIPRIEVPVLFVLENPEEIFRQLTNLHLNYLQNSAATTCAPEI